MFRRRPISIAIGLLIIAASITFSRTLAGSITIGSGNSEFGQGVLLVTNCDSSVFAQPVSANTGSPGEYRLSGFTFWGIDVAECEDVDFKVRIYETTTALSFFGTAPSATDEVTVRLIGGNFYPVTQDITVYPGDELGYFSFEINKPTLEVNAFDLKKVTLESANAGQFADCSPTVTTDGTDTVYTFTSAGACSFTAPVTRPTSGKAEASVEVTGGKGGGSTGALGEVVTNSNVSLMANSTYVVLVGAGGAVGKDGGASLAFGVRAAGGAGSDSGSTGTNGKVILRFPT